MSSPIINKANTFASEIAGVAQIPLKKLVKELHAQGYQQKQIAKWAGVNSSTVCRWIKEENAKK